MPSRLTHIEHVFDGGWAPDFGERSHVQLDEAGFCRIPWLTDCEAVEFNLDGSITKVGGATLLSSSILASSAKIRGLYDFWVQGTSGSPTQTRVLHCSTIIYMDNGDASFSAIFSGLQNDSIPDYAPFEGYLVISQTGQDVPKITDQSSHEDLPSGTPNFSFSTEHKLRQWAAGVDANPSTLYYSAQEDPTDWTGSGSGDIAIKPGDGDRITAIASFNNELFVFKGPNKGSIHRITGSAPTGDDAFARKDFIPRGLGAVGQRTIFRFGNDLGFMWSDGTIHSINTTDRYGDFLQSSLSRPLNEYLISNVNGSLLPSACCAAHDGIGKVRFGIPVYSSTFNNLMLTMDYRFDPPRWSKSSQLGSRCQCIAMVIDPTTGRLPRMMAGGYGLIYKLDSRTKIIESAVGGPEDLDCSGRTPFISYLSGQKMSTLYHVGARIVPKNAEDFTLSWVRDGRDEQSTDIQQWSGDVLAPATSPATPFTLGSSAVLGDRSLAHTMDATEGGEFQQIQYAFSCDGESNDFNIQSILSSIKPGAVITEDIS